MDNDNWHSAQIFHKRTSIFHTSPSTRKLFCFSCVRQRKPPYHSQGNPLREGNKALAIQYLHNCCCFFVVFSPLQPLRWPVNLLYRFEGDLAPIASLLNPECSFHLMPFSFISFYQLHQIRREFIACLLSYFASAPCCGGENFWDATNGDVLWQIRSVCGPIEIMQR